MAWYSRALFLMASLLVGKILASWLAPRDDQDLTAVPFTRDDGHVLWRGRYQEHFLQCDLVIFWKLLLQLAITALFCWIGQWWSMQPSLSDIAELLATSNDATPVVDEGDTSHPFEDHNADFAPQHDESTAMLTNILSPKALCSFLTSFVTRTTTKIPPRLPATIRRIVANCQMKPRQPELAVVDVSGHHAMAAAAQQDPTSLVRPQNSDGDKSDAEVSPKSATQGTPSSSRSNDCQPDDDPTADITPAVAPDRGKRMREHEPERAVCPRKECTHSHSNDSAIYEHMPDKESRSQSTLRPRLDQKKRPTPLPVLQIKKIRRAPLHDEQAFAQIAGLPGMNELSATAGMNELPAKYLGFYKDCLVPWCALPGRPANVGVTDKNTAEELYPAAWRCVACNEWITPIFQKRSISKCKTLFPLWEDPTNRLVHSLEVSRSIDQHVKQHHADELISGLQQRASPNQGTQKATALGLSESCLKYATKKIPVDSEIGEKVRDIAYIERIIRERIACAIHVQNNKFGDFTRTKVLTVRGEGEKKRKNSSPGQTQRKTQRGASGTPKPMADPVKEEGARKAHKGLRVEAEDSQAARRLLKMHAMAYTRSLGYAMLLTLIDYRPQMERFLSVCPLPRLRNLLDICFSEFSNLAQTPFVHDSLRPPGPPKKIRPLPDRKKDIIYMLENNLGLANEKMMREAVNRTVDDYLKPEFDALARAKSRLEAQILQYEAFQLPPAVLDKSNFEEDSNSEDDVGPYP